jgi:hypothetical protein
MSTHYKNIHLGKSTIAITGLGTSKVPAAIKVQIDPSNQEITGEMVPWGSDNLYPQTFYDKKFLNNGAAVGGINTLSSTTYGNGFGLYKKVRNETTRKIELEEQLLSDLSDIDLFFELNHIDEFFDAKTKDLALFELAFTEHVLSANQESITEVKRHQTAHCRYAKMDETGTIPYVFINTDWATANPKFTVPIPYFDKRKYTIAQIKEICKKKKIFNFITDSKYAFITENYYPKAGWHAVDRNGWMNVANSVPELKKAIYEQQNHFKYIVYVSDFYFESYYKEEWDDFDADKKQLMREQLATTIDDHMSGNKAGGRSLTAPIFEENGKFVKGIEIEPVDNKLKDGANIPDATAANYETLFAIGVHPAIIGALFGGSNMGGSNIREAYTVLSASLVPKRIYVTDDWLFWRSFNNWDRALIGMFGSVNLTTLDKNPSGQQNILNG